MKESLEKKWGEANLDDGWAAIPIGLLKKQSELAISPLGLNIIINLLSYWWYRDRAPYPSQETLANRIGVSKRSIQREIKNLTRLGIIDKSSTARSDKKYKGRNVYELEKLVNLLNGKIKNG
ncbi:MULTISPECIES: helix-turn-helix domain-containing protein [unclassified Pasteurella]|nr:helix-turn-helix domain-containing protein [Pasteurella sp. 19428wF3_WM03]MBF0768106.1 helix-turn-helix domain-containing protein [Parabacteroides goldsteinii]TFU49371.1 helix-turn-helix domain-containing protein [Pasteurella sp. WM03]TFU68018.1 helix-turn-helix domain-containing protein [Parabacteroides sp. P14]